MPRRLRVGALSKRSRVPVPQALAVSGYWGVVDDRSLMRACGWKHTQQHTKMHAQSGAHMCYGQMSCMKAMGDEGHEDDEDADLSGVMRKDKMKDDVRGRTHVMTCGRTLAPEDSARSGVHLKVKSAYRFCLVAEPVLSYGEAGSRRRQGTQKMRSEVAALAQEFAEGPDSGHRRGLPEGKLSEEPEARLDFSREDDCAALSCEEALRGCCFNLRARAEAIQGTEERHPLHPKLIGKKEEKEEKATRGRRKLTRTKFGSTSTIVVDSAGECVFECDSCRRA